MPLFSLPLLMESTSSLTLLAVGNGGDTVAIDVSALGVTKAGSGGGAAGDVAAGDTVALQDITGAGNVTTTANNNV